MYESSSPEQGQFGWFIGLLVLLFFRPLLNFILLNQRHCHHLKTCLSLLLYIQGKLTPLWLASSNGKEDIVELLISAGANLHTCIVSIIIELADAVAMDMVGHNYSIFVIIVVLV